MAKPGESVAISKDASFAIVTGAFKVDPADSNKSIPDNKITVIDPAKKSAIATIATGAGLEAAVADGRITPALAAEQIAELLK